jgi:ubiquinone/menaquinone biosynthesis C-methylase UbiE
MDDPLRQAKAKAAATYDAAADHFDDAPLSFWERIGKRTIDRLALSTGARILDVGCGTGASALPAGQTVGAKGSVIGVDLSARLLERARAKAKARGITNIEFRVADMTSLGYPDGHFDAVVSVFSIFFVPDMEGLVRELWRMVHPGGKLAVTTWGPRIFEPAYARWQTAIKQERPDLYSAFNPWDRITDPEAVRRLLRDGGATKHRGRGGRRKPDAALSRRLVDHCPWIGTALGHRADGAGGGGTDQGGQCQLAERE